MIHTTLALLAHPFRSNIGKNCNIGQNVVIGPDVTIGSATLGANCTIVCGTSIGRYAFIGAGAVVTKDVPDHALVVGNSARQIGWVLRVRRAACSEVRPARNALACEAGGGQRTEIGCRRSEVGVRRSGDGF